MSGSSPDFDSLAFPRLENGTAAPVDARIIKLGIVEFEEKRLFMQLRTDLKDDWLPDPLGFSDMMNRGIVRDRIVENFERNHGEYIPQKRDLFNIPKANFTLRCALETSLCDRALYHGLVAYLVPFYDPFLPWNVFNHRYDTLKLRPKYLFKHAVSSWKDYLGNVRSALKGGTFLLSTDISNYYEYINLQLLHDTVMALLPNVRADSSQKSQIRAHVDILFRCLKRWSYDETRGLPQNRDASAFLASIYLYRVDAAMLKQGYAHSYFRYMDDIRVVCDSEYRARRALKALCLALRDVGLSVNSMKTNIYAHNDSRVSKSLDEGSRVVQHLDDMWRSKSRNVIIRAIPLLQKLTLRLVGEGSFDSREFCFCLTRLSQLALCPDFGVPDAYFCELTPAIVEGLTRCPASTHELVKYLVAAPTGTDDLDKVAAVLIDEERCLYGWQSYHLWSLLARKQHFVPALIRRAADLITNEGDTAARAGATIYVGASGDPAGREHILKRSQSLKSFLGQRSALIALHEVQYPLIKEDVQPHIREDLIQVYRGLRASQGTYFAPLDRVPLAELIRQEGGYD